MVSTEHTLVVFVAQVAVLLLVGRLFGEVMQRLGQPPVIGQLLAGIALSPSLAGAVLPSAYAVVFPQAKEAQQLLQTFARFGVLLLLLLFGMETDLSLVSRMRRTAIFSSAGGILVPLASGFVLGELLPATLLPHPEQRLPTALFLGTCLAVSSVKIVAMVIVELGFARRNIGQVILATAIIDDTTAWILVGLIGGLATRGTVELTHLAVSAGGTLVFLAVSFTIGRRVVARLIQWTNDHLRVELPVVTAIVIVMCAMALVTDAIGVTTTLGAFVAGILVGQSPILTRHITDELRGTVLALFAPVFFTSAGLSTDVSVLTHVDLLALAGAFVLIASFGKIAGGYLGGRTGGLNGREAVALAIGMNARGSTEVVVASLGLAMGLVTRDMFTLIMVTAIVTTMTTPPLLRWALGRIPAEGEEKERLEREEAETREFVPNLERVLVVTDASANGQLASTVAGLLAGTRNLLTTVVGVDGGDAASTAKRAAEQIETWIDAAPRPSEGAPAESKPKVSTVDVDTTSDGQAILEEARKGYSLIVLGANALASPFDTIVREFDGPIAFITASDASRSVPPRRILVATTGTDYSRRAAELAVTIARGSGGEVTALYATRAPRVPRGWWGRHAPTDPVARAVVHDVEKLGERAGVHVRSTIDIGHGDDAIVREVARREHDLVVLGVKVRPGERLFFGDTAERLLADSPAPVLLLKS